MHLVFCLGMLRLTPESRFRLDSGLSLCLHRVLTLIRDLKRNRRWRGFRRCVVLSIYHSLPLDAAALLTLFSPLDLSNISMMLLPERDHFATSCEDNPITPIPNCRYMLEAMLYALLPPARRIWWDSLLSRPEAGRFGRKLEGSGKLRVFAIANPIFQTLLRPLHDWVMKVLRSIWMDGTFDQPKPLLRLIGKRELFSFDLKSATDLLPADLSSAVLLSLVGGDFSRTWQFLMQQVVFRSPDPSSSPDRGWLFQFTRGQPLGYYSSWPVFTLTHHMLVWMSAERVYPGKVFKDYAILGDDIVIADPKVAKEYVKTMEDCQAIISREKSPVSSNGACEFAKRFLIKKHLPDRKDFSPLSVPLIKMCCGYVSAFVFKKLGCSFRSSFRLRGGGYRVYSKIREGCHLDPKVLTSLSKRWVRHWLSMFTPSGLFPLPTKLWLAYPHKGYLTCYEEGMARSFILARVAPRDLDDKAFELLRAFWVDDGDSYMERFLLSFLKLHLQYLQWYCTVLFDYDLPFEALLDPPVSPRTLDRAKSEIVFSRYGLLFRAWDHMRVNKVPMALTDTSVPVTRDCIYAWLIPAVDYSSAKSIVTLDEGVV